MDVVADSNILIADFRMLNAEFRSLFDYLNATDSYLVIPKIVCQEVLADFSRKLHQRVGAARKGLKDLNRLLLQTEISLSVDVDIEYEIELLRRRLCLESGSRIRLLEDYQSITLEEVVKRGIERIRPASDEGEELRDVVVWMSVLNLCKAAQREVAFISNNHKQFTADDKETLHPSLSAEATAAGVTIHFYRNIGSFLAANAPKTQAIDEVRAYQIVLPERVANLFSQAVAASVPIPYRGNRTATTASIDSLDFKRGTLHEVSGNTAYCDMEFTGKANLKVTETPYFGGGLPPEIADSFLSGKLDWHYDHSVFATMRMGVRLSDNRATDVSVIELLTEEYPEHMRSLSAGNRQT
jgi:hypothetical protein